ncbi:MAG TPA: alpha/beta hydrolase, partial [Acidimicrobiia bacterium]|nr:alpha/beta hydrolase [Acidimicrobiia bacterium]
RTVRCSDHERTTRRVDLASLRRKFPWAPLLIGNRQFQDGCALLHVAPVARDYATIPATRTPTLVLAGEFDPVTPPADGKRAAKMLGEAATFVEFPTLSHAVVRTDSCARRVFQGFLANPTGKPDTSCIATIKPITWALG